MYQRYLALLLACLLSFTPLLSSGNGVLAQENTNTGFPEGVAVDSIVEGDIGGSVAGPVTLQLDRVVIQAGVTLASREGLNAEAIYVESGELTLLDSFGFSTTLSAGNSIYLRSGAVYEAANEGSYDLSLLRLSLIGSSADSSPVEAEGITIRTLAKGDIEELPEGSSSLFISRAVWIPGADSGNYVQTGPMGMVMEIGSLTVTSPSGIDGTLDEGRAVIMPADQVLRARNDGSTDATVLIFGVVPTDSAAVILQDPVASESEAEAEAEEEAALPTGVLYHADTSGGFEDWNRPAGWQLAGGMLLHDGSTNSTILAPMELPITDYAVEVELQWSRGGSTLGIVTRAQNDGGFHAGFLADCFSWGESHYFYIWGELPDGDDCDSLKNQALLRSESSRDILNTEWSLYRIEVERNTIRIFMDGTLILETSDNRFLNPGTAGLWSHGAQISIRSFTISALDSTSASQHHASRSNVDNETALQPWTQERVSRSRRGSSVAHT